MKGSLNDFYVFLFTIKLSIITKWIIWRLYIVEIDKLTSRHQQEWRSKGISTIIHQRKNEIQANEGHQ